ncbi:hypothetical protein HH214_17495 [Mucilaginibacter robiniae]|uniref:Glycosyltransferase RgtA/B/C/D-like domain-containing protein n=1 Tax=Mucilaginibacter robiniae TaxID=2728022 RepID=A0A7L5E4L0_9SPHI|nr:hypothetical protein [Mucilaginibacter robiniae]QJD97538.1 hypothetical protein HH214_17495 [Mucilaginibacter robiniae]
MIFAVLVFSHLTTLGDTFAYLNSPLIFSSKIFYSSTALMLFTGALFKAVFKADVLACIPLMLLSFYGVYYVVDRLNLYKLSGIIILLVSMPNFGVWTSIHGKEAIGCFFSGVIAVMIIKKLNGKYKLKFIDYFALYLCAMFKPQYLIYIIQALIFIELVNRLTDKRYLPFVLGCIIFFLNIVVLYFFRDFIDVLAKGMAANFNYNDPNLAKSTRSDAPWLVPYGFFKTAPYGMFIAFFGPTLSEMIAKPTHLLSGIESIIMIVCFIVLLIPRLTYNLNTFRFNPTVFVAYFIIFAGILFMQYPFGFLNPGSAIRYRCNFYLLFVMLLLQLFSKSSDKRYVEPYQLLINT